MVKIFRAEVTKDEPWAWEAREFLRKKLIGEEVWFTAEKPPNANREYGVVYLGKGNVLCMTFAVRFYAHFFILRFCYGREHF